MPKPTELRENATSNDMNQSTAMAIATDAPKSTSDFVAKIAPTNAKTEAVHRTLVTDINKLMFGISNGRIVPIDSSIGVSPSHHGRDVLIKIRIAINKLATNNKTRRFFIL